MDVSDVAMKYQWSVYGGWISLECIGWWDIIVDLHPWVLCMHHNVDDNLLWFDLIFSVSDISISLQGSSLWDKSTWQNNGCRRCIILHDECRRCIIPHDWSRRSIIPHDGSRRSIVLHDGCRRSIVLHDGSRRSIVLHDGCRRGSYPSRHFVFGTILPR